MPISTLPHTDRIEVARTLGPRLRHWLVSLILAAILLIAGYEAYVTVTLLDLGRADCRAAHLAANRIEGQVVIAMERPLETSCQDRTSITWRIMP